MNRLNVSSNNVSGTILQNQEGKFFVIARGESNCKLDITIKIDNDDAPVKKISYDIIHENFIETFQVETDKVGLYEMEAVLYNDEGVIATEYSALSVLKNPKENTKKDSRFFGMMFGRDYDAAAAAGMQIDRIQAYWNEIEMTEGTYLFARVQNAVDSCVERDISIIMTIRPEIFPKELKTNWRGYTHPFDLIKEPILSKYKKFVKEIVDRYGDKIDYFELLNEPDLEFMEIWGIPLEEAAMFLAQYNKISYDYLKELCPDIPVIAMTVSGEDTKKDYVLTKAVISAIPDKQFDMIGPHPYPPCSTVQENSPFDWPEDFKMREGLVKLQDFLEEKTGSRRMCSTEIGYALPGEARPLCYESIAYGAAVVRTFVEMKSIENFEFLTWYTFDACWDQSAGLACAFLRSYGARYPYPAMNSFAAMTYLLDNTKPAGDVKISSAVRAWKFKDEENGRVVVIMWSDEVGYNLKVTDPSVTVYDYFGRPIDNKDGVTISYTPKYIETTIADEKKLDDLIAKAELVNDAPLIIKSARFINKKEIEVTILNKLTGSLSPKAKINSNGKTIEKDIVCSSGMSSFRFELPTKENKEVSFELILGDYNTLKNVNVDFLPIHYIEKENCDGNLDFLKAYEPIVINEFVNIYPAEWMCGWEGPEDLSMTVWLGWNKKGLYFAFDVLDPVHYVDKENLMQFWATDSLQLCLDLKNDSMGMANEDDVMLGMAESDDKVKIFGKAGILGDFGCFKREGEHSIYEVFLSWENMDCEAVCEDMVCRLNFMANQSNGVKKGGDPSPRLYFMRNSHGIGDGVVPASFDEFVFKGK